MKRLGKLLLYAVVIAGFFYGGAMLSMRRGTSDAEPNLATDGSTQVPPDRASGPPPGYRPPAPEDTPCLQPEYAQRCVGRAAARTGLMTLAGLQAQRMRERGSYAEDAAALGFNVDPRMELRMRVEGDAWTAAYRHVAANVGCAVYEGDVAEPFTTVAGGVPDTPGAVACDDPLAVGR